MSDERDTLRILPAGDACQFETRFAETGSWICVIFSEGLTAEELEHALEELKRQLAERAM